MERLLSEIRSCQVCKSHLPLGPRPVVAAHPNARIVIIGQAPGTKVHQIGIPWDDPSGRELRKWLNIQDSVFYDESKIALMPMGFCYPGRGKGGDLPPRPECAPLWHNALLTSMPCLELIILIGTYSQQYYLGKTAKGTLTETVKSYRQFLPKYFPLPHPSPRNRFWQSKNPWFGQEVVPVLRERVAFVLDLD